MAIDERNYRKAKLSLDFRLKCNILHWKIGDNSLLCVSIYIYQWYSFLSHDIWAPSSEFVSSSIPSWQIPTAHAQPFRGARDLAFCLKVTLDSLLVWASSEGSGETARMHRLAWTFAARICDKYQIRFTRSIYTCKLQTYFTRNIFKVSSVCIILLTFITVTGYCGCLIYTTKGNNTFQLPGIQLHQMAMSPSKDSSFHVQTDLEIQIVLTYYYYY